MDVSHGYDSPDELTMGRSVVEGIMYVDCYARDRLDRPHSLCTITSKSSSTDGGTKWCVLEGAEYKRRPAPPRVKITSRLISRERRYPIVNGFRG